MRDVFPSHRPALLLAPMQDVTDLPFMRLMARRGGPDVFVTEYFRVTPGSRPDGTILRSITENDTGIPVVAQMIGQDIPALVAMARELERHRVAAIDLNLGCPAPIVCRKDAGGGLLRHPDRVDAILGALREAVSGRFTVKCRVGFTDKSEFPQLMEVFQKHQLDALTIHARTVRDGYRTAVHAECVAAAVAALPFPVIANGNIVDVATAQGMLARTGAAGLMIGRGAIRNPWIFDQLRATWAGQPARPPTGREVLRYIEDLYHQTAAFTGQFNPRKQVHKMKKYLVFIAAGVDADGGFEHRVRRVEDEDAFFSLCREHLDHDQPVSARPPEGSAVFCGFASLLG